LGLSNTQGSSALTVRAPYMETDWLTDAGARCCPIAPAARDDRGTDFSEFGGISTNRGDLIE
jgi:hypothetical protein